VKTLHTASKLTRSRNLVEVPLQPDALLGQSACVATFVPCARREVSSADHSGNRNHLMARPRRVVGLSKPPDARDFISTDPRRMCRLFGGTAGSAAFSTPSASIPVSPNKKHYRTATVAPRAYCAKLQRVIDLLEWRNWQTHGTQNPAPFTGHVGSTPTSSTINSKGLTRFKAICRGNPGPKPRVKALFLGYAPTASRATRFLPRG
jgi:hypothetical protein